MEYLKVKNWSKFQHYKTRNPPWIKLYRGIASDYAFCQLSDVDKCHLIMLWVEAAAHDGLVANDAAYLRRRLSLKSNPDLKLFINNGWLIENASINSGDVASIEKRREENKREETPKPILKRLLDRPEQKPEEIEKQKRIAAACVAGDLALAEQIKAGKA